jgi:ABC-type sugar transport system ATPase subunit
MRVEISRLHNRLKTTVVYVTHDQIEAMTLADRIVIMDQGMIQQVGTPLELYETPKNLFVAGFIGSPAMNFLQGESDGRAIVVGEWSFPLPDGITIPPGEAATIGIRPHYMVPVDQGGPGRLCAQVDVVEHMGSENFAYLKAGDIPLTVRLEPGIMLEEGSTVWFEIPKERALFFGADESRLGGE